ncbi:MAG: hypothetical protein K8T89_17205 [Planctomycetes bacterium]|nr:hypothetical protein [Planctomycetota bacterium]
MTGSEVEKQATAKLLDQLCTIFRPEDLISRKGAAALCTLFSLIAGLAFWYLFPLGWLNYTTAIICIAVATLICWYVGREVYLRSGSGRRLGIAYFGHRVDRSDWRELKVVLNQLFADSPTANRITIRLIPEAFTRSETGWRQKQEKYHFEAILRVTSSPRADGKAPQFDAQLQPAFKGNLQTEFLKNIHGIMRQLFQPKLEAQELLRRIKLQADSFFNTIVLFVAVQEFAEGRFDDASKCLFHLDSRLAPERKVNDPLRQRIRWLDAVCLVQRTVFEPDQPPVGDDLLRAKDAALLAAQRYGNEFPIFLNGIARICFYAGDLENAIALTRSAMQKSLQPEVAVYTILNFAVLNLFSSNWTLASENFRTLFLHPQFARVDFVALIKFADFTREMGFDSAVYIQVLYRLICKQATDVHLLHDFQEWLGDEPSKDELNTFTNELRRVGMERLRKALEKRKPLSKKLRPDKRGGRKD